MNDILASIDVLISKPGGLTTTEALLNDVPMIVPYFIPGQEEENAEFLEEKGIAVWIRKKDDSSKIINYLLSNQEELENMRKNTEILAKPNSTKNICDILLKNPTL